MLAFGHAGHTQGVCLRIAAPFDENVCLSNTWNSHSSAFEHLSTSLTKQHKKRKDSRVYRQGDILVSLPSDSRPCQHYGVPRCVSLVRNSLRWLSVCSAVC